jgi:dihydrolipoamide dehydrogenase
MTQIDTDVAVIGAGTAGLGAYRAARTAGKRALIIEGGPYGTTCARVGCMPSKLLIAAAEAAHSLERFGEFGLHLNGRLRVDGAAVMARVRRERDRFVGFVLEGVNNIPAADKIRGHARFSDARTLQVDDHTRITAHSIVIATGSSPVVPPLLQNLGERVLVNDDVFEWRELPQSVAIFGPGVIGLELGQALARLGVRVHVFGRGHGIGPLSDPAIKAYATRTLQQEFYLDTNATVHAVERSDAGIVVRFRHHDEGDVTESFDYVLATTGRMPNVAQLAIGNTNLELDAKGVPLFDPLTLQCGRSPIFIAGDANADRPLLHEAADEGRIAGENAARYPGVQPGVRRAALSVVFTDPNIALVGATWKRLQGTDFVTGEVSFEDQGRSRVMLVNKGLLHVYADRCSGRFLGAEMIAPRAEHFAHLLAWSVQSAYTVEQMLAMPYYHPVIEEGLRSGLRDLAAKLRQARVRPEGPCPGD